MARHRFEFSRAYRLAAIPFAVTPSRSYVEVADGVLRIRFGPWRVRTDVDNISGVEKSGDYSFLKTAGPAHLSLADRGITFATNPHHGVCLRFTEPVRVDFPLAHLRCSGVTLTLADPDALLADLPDPAA